MFFSHLQDLEDARPQHDEQEKEEQARSYRVASLLVLDLPLRYLQCQVVKGKRSEGPTVSPEKEQGLRSSSPNGLTPH